MDTAPEPEPDPGPAPLRRLYEVEVRVDGAPAAGAIVVQGGRPEQWETDGAGRVEVEIDFTVVGDIMVLGVVPTTRIDGVVLDGFEEGLVVVELVSFDPTDNEDYVFQHPGTDTLDHSTEFCSHCHVTINADWLPSVHRGSASNPAVQDVYAGAATALAEGPCLDAGGRWWEGLEPGTGQLAERCYLGSGTLPDLNEHCGDSEPCDGIATTTGACADCHAPGIDGRLGGRDLHEAVGLAYDYGVHCDVCHQVSGLFVGAEAGIGGWLEVTRPSEPPPGPGLGDWAPLTFGPLLDVPNPRMGSAWADFYRSGDYCGGCHQLEQEVLVPGATADPDRWPDGRLPIHTTWAEWRDGPLAPDAACQSCHMPPDPDVSNSSDEQLFDAFVGIAAGWLRPPGAVRRHSWPGPRDDDGAMLRLAAAIEVDKTVAQGELIAAVTVTNVGPGHALPTGEPMRSMVLLVEAACDGAPLDPIGGDVVPDFGGHRGRQLAGADWNTWPGAEVGDVVRVARLEGGWHDYPAWGPFGDGTFDPQAKGMPVESWAGEATVIAVDGDGVTLDAPLPEGDVAYLVDPLGPAVDGAPVAARAGAPGFAFARVLTGPDGGRMVPHHRAVDVASDNRLPPATGYTTTHRFDAPCADPDVHVVLVYRAYPYDLASERQWEHLEQVMADPWW